MDGPNANQHNSTKIIKHHYGKASFTTNNVFRVSFLSENIRKRPSLPTKTALRRVWPLRDKWAAPREHSLWALVAGGEDGDLDPEQP